MKRTKEIRTEIPTPYQMSVLDDRQEEDVIIARALQIIESRLIKSDSKSLNNAQLVEDYFRLKLRSEVVEQFWVLGLNSENHVVKVLKISEGTTNAATVYPREIVRQLISTTTIAVILVHNHPSGDTFPSKEDITITERIMKALKPIDICIYDHLVIGNNTFSFANNQMLPKID